MQEPDRTRHSAVVHGLVLAGFIAYLAGFAAAVEFALASLL
jgi:hypothetical protein